MMPLKPHPTDLDKMVYVSRQYDLRDYRKEMLNFIDEFTGAEQERHPMFSEGYDLALLHMKQLIEGKTYE
jgi:hypothetical protein